MDAKADRLERRFELPLLAAALLVIPSLIIEASAVDQFWIRLAVSINWLVWAAFALELVVMTKAVGRKGQWLRDHPLEVAIVALTAPFLPAVLQALRVGRLLRLVRLFRLLPLVRGMLTSRRLFSMTGLRWATLIVVTTVLGGGAAFAAVERDQGLSSWDGVWWAITTATTVGYGDISPHTNAGRVTAILVMVISISFVAMLTAAFAERFLAAEVAQVEKTAADLRIDEGELLREIGEVRVRLDRVEQALRSRQVQ